MVDENEILDILRRHGFTSGAPPGGTQPSGDINTIQGEPVSGGAGGGLNQGGLVNAGGQNPMEFFLRNTPGYKFAFNEGQRAVQTGAASRGTLLTGGTLKALNRYGTGIADQTYDQATKRFLSLAELGARTATAPF